MNKILYDESTSTCSILDDDFSVDEIPVMTKKIIISAGANTYWDEYEKIRLKKLQEIFVEEQNKNYISIDGILYSSEDGMENLTLVLYPPAKKDKCYIVPENCTFFSINSLVNKYLEEVVFHDWFTGFDERACDCPKVKHPFLPKSFFSIGEYGLGFSNRLSLTVDKNNPHYKVINNSLYSTDGRSLFDYWSLDPSDTFVMPEELEYIEEYMFGVKNIKKIIIGKKFDGTTGFANHCLLAFYNVEEFIVTSTDNRHYTRDGALYTLDQMLVAYPSNKKDKVFVIDNKVKKINEHVFDGARNLKKIIFDNPSLNWKEFGESFFLIRKISIEIKLAQADKHALQAIKKVFGAKCLVNIGTK